MNKDQKIPSKPYSKLAYVLYKGLFPTLGGSVIYPISGASSTIVSAPLATSFPPSKGIKAEPYPNEFDYNLSFDIIGASTSLIPDNC